MDSDKKKISLAVVGLGDFAKRRVLPVLLQCNALDLVAVVDRSQTAVDYPSEIKRFTSLDDLLNSNVAEAVYLCTPNYLHHPQTLQCLKAGRHVLCEKPMATNSRDCASMLLLAQELRLQLTVAHMLRFSPRLQLARDWIKSGRVGILRSIDVIFHYDLPKNKRPWGFRKDLSGGGALIDAGVHCIDAVRFLIGGPIVAVDSQFDVLPSYDVERTAKCTLGAANVPVSISVCSSAPYSTSLLIRGSNGAIDVGGFAATTGVASLKFSSTSNPKCNEEIQLDPSGIYVEQLQAFAGTLLTGKNNYDSAAEALENIRIVENLYRISSRL